MKKILFILALALSASFWGCGEDEVTNLRWDNQSSSDVRDIKWFEIGGGSDVDAEWSSVTKIGKFSGYRVITKLNGEAEAWAYDGTNWGPAVLDLSSGDNATVIGTSGGMIEKNTDATLIIDYAAKK